ncbi:MAG: rhomboid family intramembrane serine protease [Sphingobacteriaceae bacterium]|nr:rhomboid family intramembrane serine protease [Sphingobacteriaceae bacterium]
MKNYLGKKFIQISKYPFLFLLLIWIVFFIQTSYRFNFVKWGVLPRETQGLPGIFTSVFIHGDLDHILSNSFPIFILGLMLFFFYSKIARQVFVWIWLISGIWLWIGGRNNPDYPIYHVGASTLIYGLATFLFFSGIFRKHLRLMVVSALVVFLYGSIMWGIFPLKQEISWEGHLFGAIAGLLVAFNFRKEGPQRFVYEWENETETEADVLETEEERDWKEINDKNVVDNNHNDIKINYIYKKFEDSLPKNFGDDN